MKINFAVILVSALLPVACGEGNLDQYIAAAQSALSTSDQAANELYLDDVADSAAGDTSTTTTVEGESSTTETEAVKEDVKEERLIQMAKMVMTELDADGSGDLTLEEFLVGPKKRAEETEVDAEAEAKMTAKMTEDFNANAGADLLLSSDELKALLKSVAPRVGHHRDEKFPGGHEQRVKLSAAEVVAKYDVDGDGKISVEEFEALEAARMAEIKMFRDKNGPEGRGPQRPRGPEHGGPDGQGPAEGSAE